MKCLRCHRPITSAAVWVGGNAIGPKCAQIMGLIQTKKRITSASHKIKNDQSAQPGLFDELEEISCETE
jgi:hypothetical protein